METELLKSYLGPIWTSLQNLLQDMSEKYELQF